MLSTHWVSYIFVVGVVVSSVLGCRHEPFMMPDDEDFDPVDTTDMMVDTMVTDTSSVLCDSTKVYFDQQVLPILRASCAFSGCHDATTASDGVILDNYDNVTLTGGVRAFELEGSDLYEVLVDDDDDDRMPQAPRARLPQDQINLIATWIREGAENLSCDPAAGGCDTLAVSFAAVVKPIIETNCQSCHSGGSPSGGINLSSYAGIKARADSGQLFGSMDWRNGFSRMPQGGPKLEQCKIDQIASWINDGAENN
jgi:hypothetical protein